VKAGFTEIPRTRIWRAKPAVLEVAGAAAVTKRWLQQTRHPH
jgi:hypothetical protein